MDGIWKQGRLRGHCLDEVMSELELEWECWRWRSHACNGDLEETGARDHGSGLSLLV